MEGLKTLPGTCPIDGTNVEHLRFGASGLDIGLMPEWYPYIVKVCPKCLVGSAEQDFLSVYKKDSGHGSFSDLVRSPYSGIGKHLAEFLPARIRLVRSCLERFSESEMKRLFEERKRWIELKITALISEAFPTASEDVFGRLYQQLEYGVANNKDISRISAALTQNGVSNLKISDERLVQTGAEPADVVVASLYGLLVSGFTEKIVEDRETWDDTDKQAFGKLALMHFALDRHSVCLHLMSEKDSLMHRIREENCVSDPFKIEQVLDEYVRDDFSRKSSRGYHLLALGMNCYKTAALLGSLTDNAISSHEHVSDREAMIARAIDYLEWSLACEKYPEFDRDDRVVHLHRKMKVNVPYVFGEFGVRYMICCLRNEQGRMIKQREGTDPDPCILDPVADAILENWSKIHGKLRVLDFGTANDPPTAQVLIPRLIAFSEICFHRGTASDIKKMIIKYQNSLYERYMREAENLLSGMGLEFSCVKLMKLMSESAKKKHKASSSSILSDVLG